MRQYHDHYQTLNVLLRTDVFKHFRQTFYGQHTLDCLHYYTLPSLSWDASLTFNKVQLKMTTDSEQYLMVESGIRGAVSQISHWFAEANNELAGDYNPSEPKNFITYLDANNLYGWGRSQLLPQGGFQWLTQEEIETFDLEKFPENSDKGYNSECDMTYPEHLHDHHNDYPLAPEHLTVTEDMFSPYVKSFEGKLPRSSEKLVPNLYNKATKAVSKPTFSHSQIINSDRIRVKDGRQRILLDKPIFVGFKRPRKTIFTDTDSLTYHIETENLYADM